MARCRTGIPAASRRLVEAPAARNSGFDVAIQIVDANRAIRCGGGYAWRGVELHAIDERAAWCDFVDKSEVGPRDYCIAVGESLHRSGELIEYGRLRDILPHHRRRLCRFIHCIFNCP